MRKEILIPFILTVLFSVWVYAKDRASTGAVRIASTQAASVATRYEVEHINSSRSGKSAVLPEHWGAIAVKEAARNPFVPVMERKDLPPKPEKPQEKAEPVALKPPTPPLTYQLVGKLIDGSGMPGLYLQQGDTLVEAKPGLALDDGFSVDTVESNAVSLVYPPSGYRTVLTLPEIPH